MLAVTLASSSAQAQDCPPAGGDSQAKSNCLPAVAKKVNKPRSSLKVIRAGSDFSAATVNIQVPTAQAPSSCLTSPKAKVADAMATAPPIARLP